MLSQRGLASMRESGLYVTFYNTGPFRTLHILLLYHIHEYFVRRPNVCKTETVYQTQTYSYTWQLYCHKFHSYCSISCLPEYECNGPMVNITKTEVDCCDGFAVDQTLSTSSKRGKHGRHSSHRNSFKTNGCPISKS